MSEATPADTRVEVTDLESSTEIYYRVLQTSKTSENDGDHIFLRRSTPKAKVRVLQRSASRSTSRSKSRSSPPRAAQSERSGYSGPAPLPGQVVGADPGEKVTFGIGANMSSPGVRLGRLLVQDANVTGVLLEATERWLTKHIFWESLSAQSREAYRREKVILEMAAIRGRHSFGEGEHGHLSPRTEDFPTELQPVHLAWEELKAAQHAREQKLAALKTVHRQLGSSATGSDTVQAVQQAKHALYQLRKVFAETPFNLNAARRGLCRARDTGVHQRDLVQYVQQLNDLLGKQRFDLQVFALTGMITLEVSAAQRVGEIREAIAEELGWPDKRTLLLFRSKCLLLNHHTLLECGVSEENCEMTVARIMDETEDALEAAQNEAGGLDVAIQEELATIGFGDIGFGRHACAISESVQEWTVALICEAATQGLISIQTAARFYVQVEDGSMTDDHARATIRNLVRNTEGIPQPLRVVDERFLEKQQLHAQEASSEWSTVRKEVPLLRQHRQWQKEYSDMLAKDLRSWVR
mmetsp:Transcript_102120/g.181370  ORF Transcript_102120/g.181370 Transcript_102120/m.181370 type:complete len:525 (-) Transcript_102120:188-1762(-)